MSAQVRVILAPETDNEYLFRYLAGQASASTTKLLQNAQGAHLVSEMSVFYPSCIAHVSGDKQPSIHLLPLVGGHRPSCEKRFDMEVHHMSYQHR